MDTNELNSSWTLWFHKYNDDKWGLDSYTKLCSFNTVEEYVSILHILEAKYIQNGMLFMMRNDIKPLWESDDNKDGGCFSLKIYKQDIPNSWKILTTKMVNEDILKDNKEYNLINGISISPKNTYSIIKIWLRGIKVNDISQLNKIPILETSTPIYKKHK
tara:strand:+ start:731 stop:1210 length:480 start_codon:yes stop_codon:yes gene_type:complete